MSVSPAVQAIVEPLVAAEGLELFDLEYTGGVLRVTVELPARTLADPHSGVDMGAIAHLTRALSRAFDEHDPMTGRYTLEVSSPGLERVLRTPAHYAWAVGRSVSVKTVAGYAGERRHTGTLTACDEDAITLQAADHRGAVTIAYDDIDKAHTVFEWGPTPKPGSSARKSTKTTTKATAS